MAPQNYDPFGLGIKPLRSNNDPHNLGIKPLSAPLPVQQQPEKPKSWYEDILTVPNAIRFGGSTVGDVLAPFTFGISPFVGGALGELGGQIAGGEPISFTSAALEGGLNYMPGAGKLERTGLKELGKYALKSAGHGAIQGAVGTFPRHQVATGNLLDPSEWEMPSAGEFAGQTVGGGIMGGVVGGTLGGIMGPHKSGLEKIGEPPPTNIPSPDAQPTFDIPGIRPGKTLAGGTGPDIVEVIEPTAAVNDLLKQRGYKPYGTSENGYAQMIRHGEPPATEIPYVPPPVETPTEIPFHPEEGFTLPKERMSKPVIENLRNEGYHLTGMDDKGGGIFRPLSDFEPQEMRVPNVREGKGGLENVALGGADPRVWDVMGSSLYSRRRPVTTVKELLQNAWDEHKEIGSKESVRVLIDNQAPNPRGGESGKSITVRDRGRGVTPDQIYTVLSNLGATGKAGVQSAAGGFGFAKAAPFTGGKHVTVRSVVDTPQGRMMYTFEGNPAELKNQALGVPVNAEKVSNKIPTGLEVTTFYDKDITGFYDTADWARNMAERSPSVETPTKIASTYDANPEEARAWLDETPQTPTDKYNYIASHAAEDFAPKSIPPLMDTIKTPGADVKIHYDIEPGAEPSTAKLHLTNKGMYQGTNEFSYGEPTANVPRSIVADIIATVEEGHDDYPFSVNREQMHDKVSNAIDKWVRDNIITGVTQKRVAEIQQQYDAIAPLHPNKITNLSYLDEGNLFTADELNKIVNHPKMVKGLQTLESIHKRMLEVADSLGWTPQNYGAKWKYPSERLKKFGLLFKAPDSNGTTLGIHVPRPDDLDNSAILINLMEHLNDAAKHGTPTDQLTTALITTLSHEQAHIPGGSHDKGHSYRDADLRSKFGAENTVNWLAELEGAFGDGKGKLNSEISDLLQIYNGSRKRASGGPNALLATGISSQRLPNTGAGTQGNIASTGEGKTKPGIIREAYNAPRAAVTTMDLSAPMRQGLPLITTKAWWTSWSQQLRSLGSEKAYQKTLADLRNRPIFQDRIDVTTGKITKSLASQAGIKLMDVATDLSKREESIASNWIEKIPGARASNRAYTAYLNQLRADTFESLMKDAQRDFKAGTKGARDPYNDLVFAKEIADFVNTATGRGPLRTIGLTGKEHSLEQHAKLFTDLVFSPRLMASRVRMLNPGTYMMASPFARKQYVKALLSTAGAWGTMAGLASMAGAEVSTDTNSADFGKIRIGNTRLDVAGGFQQYLVAASRLLTGHTTSSATQRDFELGQGYRAETRGDTLLRFGQNKLHPVLKFANDLLYASERQPFNVGDRTAQMFVPLIVQDVLELAKEDPSLLPLIAPVAIGMGTQTYDRGEAQGKFIDPKNDYLFKGGEIFGSSKPNRPF